MTLTEFLGHYSLEELQEFGKDHPSPTVRMPFTKPSQLSFIEREFHASQFSTSLVNQAPLTKQISDNYSQFQPSLHLLDQPDIEESGDCKFGFDTDEELASMMTEPHSSFDESQLQQHSTLSNINPCTGLPELDDSGIDVGGNVMYVCDESDAFSSFDDCHSSFDDSFMDNWEI